MIKHRRTQRRRIRLIVIGAVVALLALGVFAYANRIQIKAAYGRLTAPALPVEEAFPQTPTSTEDTDEAPAPSRPPAPRPTEPDSTSLPDEKRLAVPFMSQAPHANWDLPYQEACEEASVLMVAGYYRGEKGAYEPDEADALILQVVAFQEKEYGFYKDTSASETKRFMEALFPDLSVEVVPFKDAEQIKSYIAEGYPVIIPADGKTLPNPNFRGGGPLYHMLVVRGYTETQFITNDPGTRLGENFLYTYDGLTNSIHDWNGGDVPNGERVMLVVRPRS